MYTYIYVRNKHKVYNLYVVVVWNGLSSLIYDRPHAPLCSYTLLVTRVCDNLLWTTCKEVIPRKFLVKYWRPSYMFKIHA